MKLHHIIENRMRQKLKGGPDIGVEQAPYGNTWMAVDHNIYDGAPDAGEQAMGHGTTKNAAVLDLVEQLEEMGYYSPEALESAMQSLFPGPRRDQEMPQGAPKI